MSPAAVDRTHLALLASTFAIAVCGLVYELLAGTVSSYLLGDSVYQFSIVIGLFMAAMGLGSYLTRFVRSAVVETFISVQLVIGVVGGTSALGLFFAFSHLDNYEPVLLLESLAIGALVGLEIPLVIRMLREYQVLRLSVSNVLTVDYLGALLASVLFPIVLVPHLGLFRTSLLFGMLNIAVAGVALYAFRAEVRGRARLSLALALGGAVVLGMFVLSGRLVSVVEARLFSGEIVFSRTTPYQHIALTRDGGATSLFVNGALQFNSLDEYRYHETLVHPALSLARRREQVLVLGGGDGLAVREVLKYPDVRTITLVDLDPAMTTLFSSNRQLRALNRDALRDPRVRVVNQDAAKFLQGTDRIYDVIIIDLPDPHDISLSRLYSRWFYTLAARRLAAQGLMVTQATSPFYAREAFWCIRATLGATASPFADDEGLHTVPYHVYVPSFGEWGFVMASPRPIRTVDLALGVPTRFLRPESLAPLFTFPPDMDAVPVEVNTLETHPLVAYYENGWSRWYR